jgi:hypothetical protein
MRAFLSAIRVSVLVTASAFIGASLHAVTPRGAPSALAEAPSEAIREVSPTDKARVIKDVLAFLNSGGCEWSGFGTWKAISDASQRTRTGNLYLHSNFVYNETNEALEFVSDVLSISELEQNIAGKREFSTRAYSYRTVYSILLKTASPVFQLILSDQLSEDPTSFILTLKCDGFEESRAKHDFNNPDLQFDHFSPSERLRRVAEISSADAELAKKYFYSSGSRKLDIKLKFSQERGPRVKRALEDLLLVHGVAPSKY